MEQLDIIVVIERVGPLTNAGTSPQYSDAEGGLTMNELIIVADLGKLKAYRIIKDPLKLASDKVEVIQEITTRESHAKASDKFTDAAGRFYLGGGIAGTASGYGEPHTAASEEERRAIKLLVEEICGLVQKEGCKKWHVALDKSISNQVLAILPPEIKARLGKNISANLTRTDKARLMDHFS